MVYNEQLKNSWTKKKFFNKTNNVFYLKNFILKFNRCSKTTSYQFK